MIPKQKQIRNMINFGSTDVMMQYVKISKTLTKSTCWNPIQSKHTHTDTVYILRLCGLDKKVTTVDNQRQYYCTPPQSFLLTADVLVQ